MSYVERMIYEVVTRYIHDVPARVVVSDNNRIAREVVYHARIAAETITGSETFDGPAIHEYIRERIQYEADMDPGNQRLRMPWRTVLEGRTDCKSSAIMIGALAKRAGCDVRLAFIDQTGSGQWDHVFAVVDGVSIDPLAEYGETLQYQRIHAERI